MTYFEFDEIDRESLQKVENAVGKGEIASIKHLLLFPQGFQKDLYCRQVKNGLVWERVNSLQHNPKFNPFP